MNRQGRINERKAMAYDDIKKEFYSSTRVNSKGITETDSESFMRRVQFIFDNNNLYEGRSEEVYISVYDTSTGRVGYDTYGPIYPREFRDLKKEFLRRFTATQRGSDSLKDKVLVREITRNSKTIKEWVDGIRRYTKYRISLRWEG